MNILKKNISILLCVILPILFLTENVFAAESDHLILHMQGLSIHPENQRDMVGYYPRKLDPHGDFVVTPGVGVSYDWAVSSKRYTHIRFSGTYISDCVLYPAGFVGAGALFTLKQSEMYSVYGCIGAGWYGRKDWAYKVPNHYSPIMQRTGKVEWILMPYPEIDFSFHPWTFPGSIVVSLFSVIYVSMLSVGMQVNI